MGSTTTQPDAISNATKQCLNPGRNNRSHHRSVAWENTTKARRHPLSTFPALTPQSPFDATPQPGAPAPDSTVPPRRNCLHSRDPAASDDIRSPPEPECAEPPERPCDAIHQPPEKCHQGRKAAHDRQRRQQNAPPRSGPSGNGRTIAKPPRPKRRPRPDAHSADAERISPHASRHPPNKNIY